MNNEKLEVLRVSSILTKLKSGKIGSHLALRMKMK